MIWLNKVQIVIGLIVVIPMILSGAIPVEFPAGKEILFGFVLVSVVIVALMILGLLGAIIDHIRFRGWTDEKMSEEAQEISTLFTEALVAGDDKAAISLIHHAKRRSRTEFSDWLRSLRHILGRANTLVTSDDLRTVNHVLFRSSIRFLTSIKPPIPDIVAFVPVAQFVDVPEGTPMNMLQIHLHNIDGNLRIRTAKVVVIPRPKILSG